MAVTRRQLRQARKTKKQHSRVLFSMLTCLTLLGAGIGLNSYLVNRNQPASRKQNIVQATASFLDSRGLNNRLHQAWAKDATVSGSKVAVAIFSKKTGQTYTYTNAPAQYKFHTASTIKVAVLASVLAKNNGQLDEHGKSLAESMIENSDNDATTELINDYLGGTAAFQAQVNRLGMTNTKVKEAWGTSTTTPTDQINLLNQIFFSSNVLNSQSQQYIQNLMQNVESDQAWGISAGSSSYALKNGWLSYGRSQWIVNSIGYVNGKGGNDYTIAVYTDQNRDMDHGQQLTEKIARSTKQVMASLDD